MRFLARILMAAVLGGGVLVPLAGASQAAGPVCDATNVLCISAITLTPSTVSNAQDVTATMRVTLSKGSPSCLQQNWDLPYGGGGPWLMPVSGSPGVYSGPTVTVRAGSRPGAYTPWFVSCEGPDIAQAPLVAAGLGKLTVTGTADTTPPRIEALTVGTTSVDVTLGDVSVPVSVTLADDVAGVQADEPTYPITLSADPGPVPTDLIGGRAQLPAQVNLTRASGTLRRGVWTGTLVLPGGSAAVWKFSIGLADRVGNGVDFTSAQLAAKGFASQVTSRTTARPPTPTGVKAVTNVNIFGAHYVYIQGPAQVAGQPFATNWVVTSTGGECGPSTSGLPGDTRVFGNRKDGFTFCTYTVQAANAVGRSTGSVKVSAWM